MDADVIEETVYRMDGTTVDVELYCHPLMVNGKKAIQTYIKDITNRKKTESKQQEMEKQINELSATVVPLLSDIGILPLRGKIDESKAVQLLEMVPLQVKTQELSYLIIDFSGIYTVDTVVIYYLFRITNVLSLLGVESVITGLRPELAVEANKLNIDLSSIITRATLKDALIHLGINHTSE